MNETLSKDNLKELNRKNSLCSLERVKGRISTSLNSIKEERNRLKEAEEEIFSLEEFLLKYEELLMEGDIDYYVNPWVGALEIVLLVLKGSEKIKDDIIREGIEFLCITSFTKFLKSFN